MVRYRLLSGSCQDITLVYDKGNNSKNNQKTIGGSPFSFVGSLAPSQHRDLPAVPRSSFTSLKGGEFGGVLAYRTRKPVFGAEQTVVVTFNEALFLGQM